jgi:hypothetical protein
MYTCVYPIQDTTIYEQYPYINAGIDSILEISKIKNGSVYESRPIIQFDLSEINSKISKFNLTNIKYVLKLFIAEENEVENSYAIEAHPVAQQWDNGNGKYYNQPATILGASWKNNKANSEWILNASASGVDSNYSTVSGGGNWYTASMGSQTFTYDNNSNIDIDITGMVNLWKSGSIQNNGIILKLSGSDYCNVKCYSYDTNTIFQPRLEILSDDSIYITGSNEYSNIIVEASESLYTPSVILDTTLNYTNTYDILIIQSESQYTHTNSASMIIPTTNSLAGDFYTGSISGMTLSGSYIGSFDGYVDFETFVGSVENMTFYGYIYNESTARYYSESMLIDALDISGSLKGVIVHADTIDASFSNTTISGSYVGVFNIDYSEELRQTTSSYEVIMPTQQTLYEYYASQSYHITGSNILYEIPNINTAVVSIQNFVGEYKIDSVITHQLYVRERFPELRYTTESAYLRETYHLPENSCYAIKDLITQQYIIDFDPIYTKINCDTTGNYFSVDCGILYPQRYYEIAIKSIDDNNNEKYFDGYKFKIIK